MPSKRTNDSVDRILQELNQQQTAAGVQDTVTDHQVDEILRSVGISTAPLHGTPEQDHRIAFAGLEDPDDGWTAPQAPVRPAPQASAPAARPRTAGRQESPQAARPAPAAPEARAAEEAAEDTGTLGDTTRTGIIKGFLLKMAPGADAADTQALNQGKNQFQKFFRDSVAVVPGEDGKIRDPSRKKRGLFGLKSAEDTDEFVPINVSLGGGQQAPQEPEQAPAEEYFPDREAEREMAPPAQRAAKKHGFLGGLFGGRDTTEEIVIPEPRQEEPRPVYHKEQQAAQPAEDTVEHVWHSKYTRRAPSQPADPGSAAVEDTHSLTRPLGATGTIYRKKRDTVEFTPGQKVRTAPPAQAMPDPPAGEPVGEPVSLPERPAVHSGFTMQLGAADAAPLDSTQDFMAAYNAVRPARPPAREAEKPAPGPAAPEVRQEKSEPAAAGRDPNADTRVVGLPPQQSLLSHREPDEVDHLVDTLTGRIRLTPVEPAHSGFTQELSGAAQMPSGHTGFTQDLGVAAEPPAHSGFTQDLGGGAPSETGFTQNLAQGAPEEPGTASFVKDIAQAINAGRASGEDRFETAAARLTQSLEDEAEEQTDHRRGRFQVGGLRLGGRAADEGKNAAQRPFAAAEFPSARRHDYERAEDAPAVRRDVSRQVLYETTAVFVTGAIALVLLALGLMAASLPVLPGPLADPNVYPAVALVLLLAAGGVCWRTFLSGMVGLVGRPTPDSLAVLPLLGAAIQCIVLLAAQNYTGDVTLLAGPAVLVLCLNTAGKRMNARTVENNFRLVSAKVDHSVAYRLKDAGALRAVTSGLSQNRPYVLVNRPTQILRGFLTNSAASGTSDKNQQQFAWLAGACALAAMLITLIRTRDSAAATMVLASVLCLGAPLAGTLLSALPARMMQRSAAQVGAVIPGWRDIRQLGRINVIQVTARDLFPSGCVSLSGIKPVNPKHIDLAIVYAASVLADAGPTLREVFLGMLGGNKNLLAEVEDRETVYGKGYVGWIKKRRVLVGNRALMQDYGVKLPSLEYEQHHTVNQRRVIYLAVSGKLFAMFQVAYQRDPDTAAVLDGLCRTGMSLVVDGDDFNCDVALLETAYSLPSGSVKVLNEQERKALDPAIAWLPESEGNMLHLGSFASFVGGLEAAAGAAEGEHKASLLVSASALFGCVLGLLLAITGGLTALPLAALVLYQAAWCVLALIFPLIQQY